MHLWKNVILLSIGTLYAFNPVYKCRIAFLVLTQRYICQAPLGIMISLPILSNFKWRVHGAEYINLRRKCLSILGFIQYVIPGFYKWHDW